jgi:nucleoside 2-deoxyribosyltransferase
VYNKDGYIGNSTTLEIGYAVACDKPIYSLEEDNEEGCRNVLFTGQIKTINELLKKLK